MGSNYSLNSFHHNQNIQSYLNKSELDKNQNTEKIIKYVYKNYYLSKKKKKKMVMYYKILSIKNEIDL
jgi:hypothetical protein